MHCGLVNRWQERGSLLDDMVHGSIHGGKGSLEPLKKGIKITMFITLKIQPATKNHLTSVWQGVVPATDQLPMVLEDALET